MPFSPALLTTTAFLGAAGLSVLGASLAADAVEERAVAAVDAALDAGGYGWARSTADGLTVTLAGTAPTEAERFRALTAAGGVVDPSRVIDMLEVKAAAVIAPPTFSVEVLRNRDGISVIGLIPAATDRDTILAPLIRVANGTRVSDLVESTVQEKPEHWDAALSFGIAAAELLPRSKISISAGRVAVTAVADSPEQRSRFERELNARKPAGVPVRLDISSPRPVITPFSLRFVIDAQGPRFDACAADQDAALGQIIEAAQAAGFTGPVDCPIGLGAPSAAWGKAAAQSISALHEIGQGTVSLTDADIVIEAAEGTPQDLFDRVTGDLDGALPDIFSLRATLPKPPETESRAANQGPPEFTAELNSEGKVQLRGRFADDRQRAAVESYARAQFGAGAVASATRLDPALPEGWSLRVLSGIEAMGVLHHGRLVVTPDRISVQGVSGDKNARSNISRALSSRLGGAGYAIDVTYDEKLDPQAALPTPQECVRTINTILASHKITFAPGSATINADARQTLDRVAEAMVPCIDVRMEIGGHTDSQGRDEMNLQLSQARAEAVLEALLARRVPVSNLTAQGYGETQPIADNDTADGREENRRIAFTLLVANNGRPALPPRVPPAEPRSASVEAAAEEPTQAPAPPEPSGEAMAASEAAETVPAEGGEGPSMDDDGGEEPMDAIHEEDGADPDATGEAVETTPEADVTSPTAAESETAEAETPAEPDPAATLSPDRPEPRPENRSN